MTVAVWRVNPYFQECLSKQLSLHCGQPQLYLAALGPQLVLTFEEPSSDTFSLTHFNLLNQNRTDHPRSEGHLDHITGLCVCPDMEVFVSSSVDGTVRMWNEENRLIRMFQLNAVPECVAYSGFGGEMFLGIKGNLYRMSCAKFLPHIYQQMLLYTYCAEPLPDSSILKNEEKDNITKTASRDKDEEEKRIASNLLMTEDMCRQKEDESLVTSNMDLAALLLGTVKCKKGKPASTKETQKEAFDRYMKIIYRLPPNIKIELEDTFDPNELNHVSFDPEPNDNEPCKLPTLEKVVRPKLNIPVHLETKKCESCFSLVKKMAPVINSKPKTLMKIKPQPFIVEKKEEPRENIPPKDQPKPKPLTPPARPARSARPAPPPRTPTPLPPQEPTPEMPVFLKQFSEADWFKDLYTNNKCIQSSLSPEDFSLQLLQYLNTCSTLSKIKILAALQALHSQGLIPNTDKLYQGLIDLVPKFVSPHMSHVEQTTLCEILNLLVCLKSASYNLVLTLLTLLAYKKLHLRETILRMLTALGVDEAEQWLWPELEIWDSELQDQSYIWKSLYGRANCWLELWISKYKGHNKHLFLRSKAKCKPPTFTVVEVLNYFCTVQKEEYKKAQYVAPVGQKNTVLLPLYDCSSHPILRLGETYSMARIRRSPDEDWLKASTRRYFIQQQSYVEYYR
ncbi:hypothetical protein PAMA_008484 [Pampus argenteus]